MSWAQVYPWLLTPRILRVNRPWFVFGGCLFICVLMFAYLVVVGFSIEWDLMVLAFFAIAWVVCSTYSHFSRRP